jgi:hypothetical protein
MPAASTRTAASAAKRMNEAAVNSKGKRGKLWEAEQNGKTVV